MTVSAVTMIDPELDDALTNALQSAREESARAERAMHVAVADRGRAARALENAIETRTVDEEGRRQLRAAYAIAAASVEQHRLALERAREVERATAVLAESMRGGDTAVSAALITVMTSWRKTHASRANRRRTTSAARAGRLTPRTLARTTRRDSGLTA